MTMQALTIPPLDPNNAVQMYCYFTAWLNAVGSKKQIEDSNREIGLEAAEFTEQALEEGLKAMGIRRGNPDERTAAYTRKYNWPTMRGPDGALLHPVMVTQTVPDPQTGAPVSVQVPSETEGEDLWRDQQRTFPRQFRTDALDAYELGAPLPEWVLAYALANGAEPKEPQPVAPLRDELPVETRRPLY